MAPESVTPGEEFSATEASSSITSPAELTESFVALGVGEVRGHIRNFTLDGTEKNASGEVVGGKNLLPAEINAGEPAEYSGGLPFFAPVEKGKAVTFAAPSLKLGETGRTYTYGPMKVTGSAGENTVQVVDPRAGFVEEAEAGFKATGKGIVSEIEGYNAKDEKVIGPLTVACTAPKGVTVATIPITAPPTTTTTSSASPTTTTTTTTSSVPTTTTTTSAGPTEVKFVNWKLKGFLKDKKLNESINLPEGCTFNGHAVIPGELEANTACPSFTATVKLVDDLPSQMGLEFTEAGPVKGSITAGKTGGDLLFKATAKDNITVTSIALLGLKIPTACETSEPVVFPLEAEAPASALATGLTVSGTTTLPSVKCNGGLLGRRSARTSPH